MKTNNMFCRTKAITMLVVLKRSVKKTYCYQLAKKIDSSYAHVKNVLSKLENLGLITSYIDGRRRYVDITDSGKEIAKHFIAIQRVMEGGGRWEK